jgi:hypothetical protein
VVPANASTVGQFATTGARARRPPSSRTLDHRGCLRTPDRVPTGTLLHQAASSVRFLRERLGDPSPDEMLDEGLWQRCVDWELKRSLGRLVACNFVSKQWKYGAAVGKVAEVVLESGESGDDLPVDSERRDLIRDPFFGLRYYVKDRLPQPLQSAPFRLLESRQVLIDLVTGHVGDFCDASPRGQEARCLRMFRSWDVT